MDFSFEKTNSAYMLFYERIARTVTEDNKEIIGLEEPKKYNFSLSEKLAKVRYTPYLLSDAFIMKILFLNSSENVENVSKETYFPFEKIQKLILQKIRFKIHLKSRNFHLMYFSYTVQSRYNVPRLQRGTL